MKKLNGQQLLRYNIIWEEQLRFLTIIPLALVGHEMIESQRGV